MDKKSEKGFIIKHAFNNVMRAWCAYSSTDINGLNELEISEIKFMIFAFEGDKPDDFRLVEEMK